LSFQLMFSILR